MKISIIVPVYNVEDFLYKCVSSIMNQTYKNLEIILVNDGSTDGSLIICNELKVSDSRIKVINKFNGGLSSARNAGLEIATGELISFIDSDDWIEPDFIELLYNGIVIYDADISVVHFTRVRDFNKIEFSTTTQNSWLVFDRFHAMETLFSNNLIGYSAVNKLYKRYLFTEIRYPEGRIMEDKGTTYKLVHKVNKVVVNKSPKYHYYLRMNSIIRSKFNSKYFDSIMIHEEIIEFIDKVYPQLRNIVRARYVHESIRLLLMMIRSNYNNKEEFEKCIDIVSSNKAYVLKERNVKFTVKILAILFSIFPTIPLILSNSRIVSGILRRSKMS